MARRWGGVHHDLIEGDHPAVSVTGAYRCPLQEPANAPVMFGGGPVEYRHQILHTVVQELGGYSELLHIEDTVNYQAFRILFTRVWNNYKKYPEVDHCIGRNERITGNCKKLINAKTGNHVFSDGSSA